MKQTFIHPFKNLWRKQHTKIKVTKTGADANALLFDFNTCTAVNSFVSFLTDMRRGPAAEVTS